MRPVILIQYQYINTAADTVVKGSTNECFVLGFMLLLEAGWSRGLQPPCGGYLPTNMETVLLSLSH